MTRRTVELISTEYTYVWIDESPSADGSSEGMIQPVELGLVLQVGLLARCWLMDRVPRLLMLLLWWRVVAVDSVRAYGRDALMTSATVLQVLDMGFDYEHVRTVVHLNVVQSGTWHVWLHVCVCVCVFEREHVGCVDGNGQSCVLPHPSTHLTWFCSSPGEFTQYELLSIRCTDVVLKAHSTPPGCLEAEHFEASASRQLPALYFIGLSQPQ